MIGIAVALAPLRVGDCTHTFLDSGAHRVTYRPNHASIGQGASLRCSRSRWRCRLRDQMRRVLSDTLHGDARARGR
eukprot:1231414-Prymnesium_polylepis.1